MSKPGSASNSAVAPQLLPALDDDSSMGLVKGEQENSIPLGFFGLDSTPSSALALDARADISPKAGLRCVVCNELKAIQFNWCLTCYEVIIKSLDELEKFSNLDDIGTPSPALPAAWPVWPTWLQRPAAEPGEMREAQWRRSLGRAGPRPQGR